jgi:hypothetical protein
MCRGSKTERLRCSPPGELVKLLVDTRVCGVVRSWEKGGEFAACYGTKGRPDSREGLVGRSLLLGGDLLVQ